MSAAAVAVCALMLVSCAFNGTETGIAKASYAVERRASGSSAAFGNTVAAEQLSDEMQVPGEESMNWPISKLCGARISPKDSNALDLLSSRGMDVLASFRGTVEKVWFDDDTGFCVIVRHEGGIRTVYSFLESIEVQDGMEVEAMDVLGYIGSVRYQENDDLAHLEFRVFSGEEEVDPGEYLKAYNILVNTWHN